MVNNGQCNRAVRCNSQQDNKNMRRLRAIDLAIAETVLYLDAYPENKAALAYYNKLISEREKLELSLKQNGEPLTNHDVNAASGWSWIRSPWPWQPEAN